MPTFASARELELVLGLTRARRSEILCGLRRRQHALLFGFLNLARPGSGERSQKLMRWRVGLQFVAIAVIVIVLLTRMH